jgi:hypothetical protein
VLYQVDDQLYEPAEVATTNLFNTFLDALDGVCIHIISPFLSYSFTTLYAYVLNLANFTTSPTAHTVLTVKLAMIRQSILCIPITNQVVTKVNANPLL